MHFQHINNQKWRLSAACVFALLLGIFSSLTRATSADNKWLSDAQSDPNTLALMRGFPPAPDKRVMLPDSNFFSFPNLRWSVCHMRELLPTTSIKRDPSQYSPLDYEFDAGIQNIEFMPTGGEFHMSWMESLSANYTDGMLIIHKGKVVYEHYRGCMDEHTNHAAMSMTKSLTGLVAEILVAQNKLDEKALVSTIIPELADSAFSDATVRQVMDMTTSLKFNEHYADPQADIWTYSYASNPLPKPKDYQGPVGYFEYLQTVKKSATHGEAFGYKTVNSDVLGWLIARVTNQAFNRVASDLIWSRIGAEHDADITVDGIGTPFAGGGLSASLRDLGRLGLLVLNEGKQNGKQVIPKTAIQSIRQGGDRAAFKKAGFTSMPEGSYRSMWWHFHNKNGAFAARGVHGQTIYIDPTAEMVLVRLASHPSAANALIDRTSLPLYEAIAEYLMGTNQP